MNADVINEEESKINSIKKFLLMNYYLTTFNIKKFKECTKDITNDTFYILYFIFNVFIISMFNSAVPQLLGDNASKEVRILIGNYEKNNFEYFVSFILGYLFLFFTVKFICDKADEKGASRNHIILKGILCVSGSFFVIKLIGNVVSLIFEFFMQKTTYFINESVFWYLSGLYLLWLWFIYSLIDFEKKKDKLVVILGVVFCLLLNFGSIMYCTSFQSRIEEYLIAEILSSEQKAERILFNSYGAYKDDTIITVPRRASMARLYDIKEFEEKFCDVKDEYSYDYLTGIAISDMNYASGKLFKIKELSYKERYKYILLYILTNLFIECDKKDEIMDAICSVIRGNNYYADTVVEKYKKGFEKRMYGYLTPNEVEMAIAALESKTEFFKNYQNELMRKTDYKVRMVPLNEYKLGINNCWVEFIDGYEENFNELYFVEKLIRFIPVF